ncbi:L-ribulose-5-phosphate 3-epimerase [Psittacicella hinzii]|uniref:L-ribulose-5-phosphate 3-epimerase n=1 Tax=Psittacicella hinzii TaxID=2028575 RepID=A0A3A1YJN4_9GAMM|nr:L-ribulose-5-phosphate 3-epimerase [Psittacicella hinzii]RIY37459.1 xylulose 5-phosphate 3-epimerase [Psittacicella hinzii]
MQPLWGLYEKALPAYLSWEEKFKTAQELGFDYLEMSVDESDEKLARLDMSLEQRLALKRTMLEMNFNIPSMCLSAHRRFTFGSHDPAIREQAKQILIKAVQLAIDLGIRNIQLAGYDVYYEEQDEQTLENFKQGMLWAAEYAAQRQIMLSMEIMDTEFMSSISRWLEYDKLVNNPWFAVYPDLGNLSAWGNNVAIELTKGIGKITAIHLKDTLAVTPTCKGQFRDLPFGAGCVDFVGGFKILQELQYKGSLLIEMWATSLEDPVAQIAQAKAWLEQQLSLAIAKEE